MEVIENGLSNLKGHCHTIWQLYKRLEGAFTSIEFQNCLGVGLSGHAGLGLPDAFQRRRDFTPGHRAQPDA